jgi:hypothetical protein
MKIAGQGTETFLYINGIRPARTVCVDENVAFQPAECEPTPEYMMRIASSEIDLGVMAIFLRRVTGQLHITGAPASNLAAIAWNANWDGLLLAALFKAEAVCNFQSDRPALEVGSSDGLRVTNYHLRGLCPGGPRSLDESECDWLEEHFRSARSLLKEQRFQNAVHALSSYRWNPHPRVQLAIIWAGIEGLFEIESELVFRLSLYCSMFLAPADIDARRGVFELVKSLYKQRSAAVHGGKVKGDPKSAVAASADLLHSLVRRCVTGNGLPDGHNLAP